MKTNQELAEMIYTSCYGHLDDKYHRAEKETEILDWLNDGEPVTEDQIEYLDNEWRDYSIEDPNCR